MQGSCGLRVAESSPADLLRRRFLGEAQDAPPQGATDCVRSMGERRSEFRRSTPCSKMGMLDWTPAHQHTTGSGAGGSPTLPLSQTYRRLKLGLQSASIEPSGGYFCYLRDNIWLEDEKKPGTLMNFPYQNWGERRLGSGMAHLRPKWGHNLGRLL